MSAALVSREDRGPVAVLTLESSPISATPFRGRLWRNYAMPSTS